jgi:hypothetical protein
MREQTASAAFVLDSAPVARGPRAKSRGRSLIVGAAILAIGAILAVRTVRAPTAPVTASARLTSVVTTPVARAPIATASIPAHVPVPAPVSAPASARASAPASTTGHLRVTITGRRIFLDGRSLGEGPLKVPVACGRHDVRVGSSGKTQSVEIPCDDTLTVP